MQPRPDAIIAHLAQPHGPWRTAPIPLAFELQGGRPHQPLLAERRGGTGGATGSLGSPPLPRGDPESGLPPPLPPTRGPGLFSRERSMANGPGVPTAPPTAPQRQNRMEGKPRIFGGGFQTATPLPRVSPLYPTPVFFGCPRSLHERVACKGRERPGGTLCTPRGPLPVPSWPPGEPLLSRREAAAELPSARAREQPRPPPSSAPLPSAHARRPLAAPPER